ncbi:hypothetical protein JQS43_07910 [Natronosporangium hydrolyticum]|uniref:Uncharacterized protein n=1 Tax=Natronosporangium hydrolyticum TaxID=2811111 RepID=A0A895YJK7_9ACTN|nr:hypothetical protein [Natronosporangium hydrolyticum]QSB16212.1 hypothetical protein JQS43_07910 [Natronosporangium hydrolyticum]
MRTIRGAAAALGTAATLLLVGCGEGRDLVDRASEGLDQLEDAQEQQSAAVGDGATVEIDGRVIDAHAHYNGLEYTFGEVAVVDLDEGSDARLQGVELVFDVDVRNPGNDPAMASPGVSLRWDEPGSENVVEVGGRGDFRQVPGGSSASGEIVVPLRPPDMEVFDEASARLILGQSGRSAAEVPVGADAELIDRFPVPQPDLAGSTLEVAGVTMTIETANIRWNYGNSHVEDGSVLLDLSYTWENESGAQVCHRRGTGQNFSLVAADGSGYVDEGVSIRCAVNGETAQAATGFLLEGDYAGEYTFSWDLSHRGDDYDEAITVTLHEGPGVPDSEL